MASYAVGNPSGHLRTVALLCPLRASCAPPAHWGMLAVCKEEKPLVHISSCPFHCPPHSLFPTATSRWLTDTASASSGSVLGLAGTGSGQHEGSCCSQKLPLQPSHFESLPWESSPGPQKNPRQMHTSCCSLPKGQIPWRGCQASGQNSCWDTGQEIVFVSAPAPWPWQCPQWRSSCSPGHRACTGSWMSPSVITQMFSIK